VADALRCTRGTTGFHPSAEVRSDGARCLVRQPRRRSRLRSQMRVVNPSATGKTRSARSAAGRPRGRHRFPRVARDSRLRGRRSRRLGRRSRRRIVSGASDATSWRPPPCLIAYSQISVAASSRSSVCGLLIVLARVRERAALGSSSLARGRTGSGRRPVSGVGAGVMRAGGGRGPRSGRCGASCRGRRKLVCVLPDTLR